MALTKRQAKSALNLFIDSFMDAKTQESRKNRFILFKDCFGNEIANWQEICIKRLCEQNAEPSTIYFFKEMCSRKCNP